jgi:hypothetical protein|nr:MAG TPA: distal tail protein [Caudoviricetes sp.]
MRNGIVDLIIKLGDEEYSLAKLFDMRVLSFSITPPKVVTNIVSIPYSNTFVDLTEVYGKPTYNQRNVEIEIDSIETTYIWQKYIDEIINLFHGQKAMFSITSDSEYWYTGRCSIEPNLRDDNLVNKLTVKFVCDPFKKHYITGEERL